MGVFAAFFRLPIQSSQHVDASNYWLIEPILRFFVGPSKFMNDSIIFRWSSLYRITIYDGFFDLKYESQDGIHLYIIGDKGYVLLP
jgi:hypothetical protein